jgi:hypothetical protein
VMGDGCLGCERIAISAVDLTDGRVVCDQCPDWRHECEVRHVAGMKTKDDRQRYLAGVQDKRGLDARQRIIDGLREMVKA